MRRGAKTVRRVENRLAEIPRCGFLSGLLRWSVTNIVCYVFGVQMGTPSSEIRKVESETKTASFLFSDCLTADGRARQCGRRARWPGQDRALFHKNPDRRAAGRGEAIKLLNFVTTDESGKVMRKVRLYAAAVNGFAYLTSHRWVAKYQTIIVTASTAIV